VGDRALKEGPERMNFTQFQASRKEVDDISKYVDDATSGQCPQPGLLYCNDQLFIEQSAPGHYTLRIANIEQEGTDLEALERDLYAWASDEGYFDESP
jgi:hypothetical protein